MWWLIFGLRLCGIITYDMTKNMKFDIEYFFKICLAYPKFYEKTHFIATSIGVLKMDQILVNLINTN